MVVKGIEYELVKKYALLLKITTEEKLKYGMTQEEFNKTIEQMCLCFYDTLLCIQEDKGTPLKSKMYIEGVVKGHFYLGGVNEY